MTSAVLLLLYVTLMPTAPILVDRITAPVRQDLQATEKIDKVGENTLANKLVLLLYHQRWQFPGDV